MPFHHDLWVAWRARQTETRREQKSPGHSSVPNHDHRLAATGRTAAEAAYQREPRAGTPKGTSFRLVTDRAAAAYVILETTVLIMANVEPAQQVTFSTQYSSRRAAAQHATRHPWQSMR